MTMTTQPMADGGDDAQIKNEIGSSTTLRMLALHGSGGTAESIVATLAPWRDTVLLCQESPATTNGGGWDRVDISAVNGHHPKDAGWAWWDLPPGARSSTATAKYNGFDTSRTTVLDAISSSSPPHDAVLAHSQGAILIAALLAVHAIPQHPRRGYILNGVAWPNPFSAELESLNMKTIHSSSEKDGASPPPRILVIVGERDTINPPDQAQRVAAALQRAGCRVTRLVHGGGHAIPTRSDDENTLNAIRQWLLEGSC